ncbi:MAG: hypothetical protein FJ405_15030 [Verrucomicrobia bacterium]|nr:hypothetical protein [Verrucomicrobiota bacterium]
MTGLLLFFIALGAWFSWSSLHAIRDRLSVEDPTTLDLASHFREQMTDLNTDLLRFAVGKDPSAWEDFSRKRAELKSFLDLHIQSLPSPEERAAATRLQGFTHHYWRSADRVRKAVESQDQGVLAALAVFEGHAERVLTLSAELSDAAERAQKQFIDDANRSLEQVLASMLIGLVVLLGLAGGLAWVVYRDLIAPLSVQLIESRQHAQHSEKLASLGMLAAGVAHEIRNPLTAIKARLFTLRRRLSSPQDKQDSEVIDNEISRLERIVRDFLEFARPSEPDLSVTPAFGALEAVASLLRPQLSRRGLSLQVCDEAPGAHVAIDSQQIHQVLINLIQNAADASPAGADIVIKSRFPAAGELQTRKESVILEVQDFGPGIAPDVQKRLFDPFFSTKEAGTGLGLPIASRIVERHNGVLQFQTQPGVGTAFGVVLPIATAPTVPAPTPPTKATHAQPAQDPAH